MLLCEVRQPMPTALLIAAFAIAAAITAATPAHAQDAAAIPDPRVTPGEVVSTDRALACAQGRTPRPWMVDVARDIFALYGVPWAERHNYELDHLIPRCLGGADEMANLWPQPLAEAVRKDRVERAVCHAVCDSQTMSIEAAQQFFIQGQWRRRKDGIVDAVRPQTNPRESP
jgi:hypothetical protein